MVWKWYENLDLTNFEIDFFCMNQPEKYYGNRIVKTIMFAQYLRKIVSENYYDCGTTGEFEEIKMRITSKYHEILTAIYGDYMKLPPLDKRRGSHVSCLIETEENGAR